MKASEFLMAKALEHDDFRLTKIAQQFAESDKDPEYISKEAASPMFAGLQAVGKQLIKSNVVKNTALGAGAGAVAGAVTAQDGNRLSGALKGGLFSAAVGGGLTYGNAVRKAYTGMGDKATLGKAFKTANKEQLLTGKTSVFNGVGKTYNAEVKATGLANKAEEAANAAKPAANAAKPAANAAPAKPARQRRPKADPTKPLVNQLGPAPQSTITADAKANIGAGSIISALTPGFAKLPNY